MRTQLLVITLAGLGLAGCEPPELQAGSIAGRTFILTNRSDSEIRINEIEANDREGSADCVQRPNVTLAPGQTHTVTFANCGDVTLLEVETDWTEYEYTFPPFTPNQAR